MIHNPFSLDGKTILVTGASSGIGRAAAIAASQAGANIILTARCEYRLQETLSMLEKDKLCHRVIIGDLSEATCIQEIVKQLELLDGVVSGAGISKFLPIQFITREILDNVFGINAFSHILLTKELIKQKKLKKPASMVYISSISGLSNTSPGNALYGASKAALTAYVKYAALELAHKGIRCNSIHPGRIETPLINHNELTDYETQKDISMYPLKRYGKPEEVARQIVYLLSDASSWITGSQFVIDGGRSLI